MKTAKELLFSYLAHINDPDEAIKLFAEDAVIELPYLASLGLSYQMRGREVIYNFLKNLPDTFANFKFQNIQIHIDTPDQAFGEYEVNAVVNSTAKPYHQTYMGRLVAENGKIKLLREALDMIVVARGMFPDSLPQL